MTAPRIVLAGAGALLLSGCVTVNLGSDELACRAGDDGAPANGVVLMAQAVPSSSLVPCLDTVPLGWHLSEVELRDGSGRFTLDPARDGVPAIEVSLTAACDTGRGSEIPSDRREVRRYEEVIQLSPAYVGTRYYVFDGGCLTVHFGTTRHDRAEPLAVATEGIDLVLRSDVEAHVHEEADGRLRLDPTPSPDGAP